MWLKVDLKVMYECPFRTNLSRKPNNRRSGILLLQFQTINWTLYTFITYFTSRGKPNFPQWNILRSINLRINFLRRNLSVKVKAKLFSHVQLFATPWTVAYHTPPSLGSSREEYWSGLPFPSPEDLLHPVIEPRSPTLQADTLLSEPPGKSF